MKQEVVTVVIRDVLGKGQSLPGSPADLGVVMLSAKQ